MRCRILAAVFVVAAGVASVAAQSITATKAYVDRRYADATNAVPSIVTNEVAVEWSWTITPATYLGVPVFLTWDGEHSEYVPRIDGMQIGAVGGYVYPPTNNMQVVFRKGLDWSGDDSDLIAVCHVRSSLNALGLARMEDLEKLPTHKTVTNVARSVVNSVWDASLGVAWEARMHNGHLYYIAVTNRQEVAE